MDRPGSLKENRKEVNGEINDKRFSKRIHGSDGGVGSAAVAYPKLCTDVTMRELAWQSPDSTSPVNSQLFPCLVGQVATIRRQGDRVNPRRGISEFIGQGTKDVPFCG